MTYLDKLIASYRKSTEAKVVRRVARALAAAGTPVVSIWDGEQETPALTESAVIEQAANLDHFHLYTASGSWVFIVNGNEWAAISDYAVRLEAALAPVNKWIASKW
jgi:hypothetical protein